MLRDLVEHFSSLDLSVANLPEDELGQGYEYLIKRLRMTPATRLRSFIQTEPWSIS